MSFLPVIMAKIGAGISLKLGIDQLKKRGYMPQSTYISAAMKAQKQNDLDKAVRHYRLAVKNKEPTEDTEMAREIIEGAINVRIDKLQERIEKLERKIKAEKDNDLSSVEFLKRKLAGDDTKDIARLRKEIKNSREGIEVLKNLKEKLQTK